MKFRLIFAAAIISAILCGCSNKIEAEITETTTETSATTFNEYILTRGWTGDELLSSIYYCGKYNPLPMNIDDYPDFTLSDNILYFPDNSSAEAETNADGQITALKFTSVSAPSDFSVYGINFKAKPDDIPEKIGFANYVYGDKDTNITFFFEDGGITSLVFEFREKKLDYVYISV